MHTLTLILSKCEGVLEPSFDDLLEPLPISSHRPRDTGPGELARRSYAMMSGRSSLSILAISSFSRSFRFFRRCI